MSCIYTTFSVLNSTRKMLLNNSKHLFGFTKACGVAADGQRPAGDRPAAGQTAAKRRPMNSGAWVGGGAGGGVGGGVGEGVACVTFTSYGTVQPHLLSKPLRSRMDCHS